MNLTINNPYITHAKLDCIKFDEYGFAAIQRAFQKAGADNNIEMLHDNGRIIVMKKFFYEGAITPHEDDKGIRFGIRYYTLDEYLFAISRLNRIKSARIRGIQSAHDRTLKIMLELKEELK